MIASRAPQHAAPTFLACAVRIALVGIALVGIGYGTPALAQQVNAPATEPPPIPEGVGVVRGQVVHPTDVSRTADVPVVLYGLSRDGEPGLANTRTDAQGAFRFEGVSTAEGMAYLVGAKYGEIPFFGPSRSFAAGETELEVAVIVADPTPDASGISVDEVIVQVEWVGGKLALQELHRVRNDSGSVVLVEEAQRGGDQPAPFKTQLPSGASDFLPMAMGFEDAFDERDGLVRYWGPLYPGGQDVRFQYLLPARTSDTPIAIRLPMGAQRLSVLTAGDGPVIVDRGILEEDEGVDLDGRRFKVLRAADLARGAEIVFAVGVAVTSADTSRLSLPRADLWLELDDTQLVATQNVELVVTGADRLASRSDEPLLRFALPRGAELVDMSPETRALGISVQESAGGASAELRGPIPPGETTLRLRYRVPASPEGVAFALAFPRDVETLNVLVADTGVDIESDRLHRRRPFAQGTRTYLHREAFQISADESLAVALRPIARTPLGRKTSMALAVAGIAGALLFLLAPLRGRLQVDEAAVQNAFAMRREAIYQDILDLDHDFETGKLDEADHRTLRAELRKQAAGLLERERGAANAPATAAAAPPTATATAGPERCPGCAEPIQARWTFCSHCGAKLAGPEGANASAGA